MLTFDFRQPTHPPGIRGGWLGFVDALMEYGLERWRLYYGVYRAEVVSTDAPDNAGTPDPMGRIRVRVPAVGDRSGESRMAWPVVPSAGDGYGLKVIPPVGGHVYVVFENGRLTAPLWIGSWWTRGEVPSDLEAAEAQGWITPAGHKLVMDGSSGSETVLLEHTSGARLEIDSDGNVAVEAASGAKVTLGPSGASEAAVKGDTLQDVLESLIDAVMAITVATPVGPSTSPLINSGQFIAIRARLSNILSRGVDLT